MNNFSHAGNWIQAKLKADSALNTAVGGRIFKHPAPPNTEWPVVTFQTLYGSTTDANGHNRVLARPVFVVRAIAKGGSEPQSIADRIDEVLHGASGSVEAGWYVGGVFLEGPFELSETVEGQVYRHLGGRYQLAIYEN